MDKIKNYLNILKEKTKKIIELCQSACTNLYSRALPFFKDLTAYKRQITIGIVAVVLIGGGVFAFYLFQDSIISWVKEESPTYAAIRKAELVSTGEVGSKLIMGDLEVSLLNTIRGTYHPLEVDENFKRVPPRGYFGLEITIFNTGYNEKEFLLFGLTDDLGNQYERVPEAEFYLDGVRDFGPAREIYPRTIRGGSIGGDKIYLLFPAIDPNAKKLQLIVMSETQNKKVIFEITP